MRQVVPDPCHVPWTPAHRPVGWEDKHFLDGLSRPLPHSGVPEASLNRVVIKQGEVILKWKNTFVCLCVACMLYVWKSHPCCRIDIDMDFSCILLIQMTHRCESKRLGLRFCHQTQSYQRVISSPDCWRYWTLVVSPSMRSRVMLISSCRAVSVCVCMCVCL